MSETILRKAYGKREVIGVRARRLGALGLLAILLMGLPGCIPRGEEIVIGTNLELSGKLSLYGTACSDGVRLAIEEANARGGVLGRTIKLVEMDNRSLGSEAALAAIRLGDLEGASVIIGPSTSGAVKASASSGVETPILTPTATANDLMEAGDAPLFRLCYTDEKQGRVMGTFGRAMNLTRAVVLTESTSDYSRGTSSAFIESFERQGGEIVAQQFYPSGENDFHPLITRIKDLSFDCLFLPGYYGEAGLLIRQFREMGIDLPILGCDSFDSPAIEEIAGAGTGGIYFSNHLDPADEKIEAFAAAFVERFGYRPTAYATLGYEAASVALRAIEWAGSGDPQAVLKALEDPDFFYEGITGPIAFDRAHNAVKQVWINTIDEGERYALGEGRED